MEVSRRKRYWRGSHPSQLITSAPPSAFKNRRRREWSYVLIQLGRFLTMLLMICCIAVWENWWLTAVLAVVTVLAPAFAVVIANEKGEKSDKRHPKVYKPALARQARVVREKPDYSQIPDAEHYASRHIVIDHDEEAL